MKFPRVLRGEVLFNFGEPNADTNTKGFVLGSLSSAVPERFNGQFDVVLGNPPWTRLRSLAASAAGKASDKPRLANINREFTEITRRVLKTRNLADFKVDAYEITHEAIAYALALLRASGFDLPSAQENAITQQLEWILENRLRQTGEVPGFDERVFHKVRRGAEVTNFDGKHPSKKPDLVFDLERDTPLMLSTLDALFVECKPVDASHPLLKHYGEMGAWRFICGDYSWAMQEGMMLAYVRNGHTLAASLSPALAADPLKTMLGDPTPIGPVSGSLVNPMVEELHVSTHRRNFAWPQGKGNAGPIRIYHSWHNCS